jgi:hypothetical protein
MDEFFLGLRCDVSTGGNVRTAAPGHYPCARSHVCFGSANLPKCSIPRQKINVDNKARFRYLDSYWFRLIEASICGAAAEADTQCAFFP